MATQTVTLTVDSADFDKLSEVVARATIMSNNQKVGIVDILYEAVQAWEYHLHVPDMTMAVDGKGPVHPAAQPKTATVEAEVPVFAAMDESARQVGTILAGDVQILGSAVGDWVHVQSDRVRGFIKHELLTTSKG